MYIKGTISISQGAIFAKLCLSTPFDFNSVRFIIAVTAEAVSPRRTK